MMNFTKQPTTTRVVFGKGCTAEIGKQKLISPAARVLVLCGAGGSADRCGALPAVLAALPTPPVLILRAVTPNPTSELCTDIATQALAADVDWIVAIGGGSAIDAAKFVAVCIEWIRHKRTSDPFDCVTHWLAFEAEFEPRPAGVAVAAVVTMPASGSETNTSCVISHAASRRKMTLTHPSLAPVFAVLDPVFGSTLTPRLVAGGIADAFVHVLEQYSAHQSAMACVLQDRQAEALLCTLLEIALPAMQNQSIDARAMLLWTATQAQDGLISCGVDCCWAAHQIAHEITAFYGVEHAQSVAILMPAVLSFQLAHGNRQAKLAQCARRVFGIAGAVDDALLAQEAIARIVAFFTETLGLHKKLSECGVDDSHFGEIASRFEFMPLGAECNIDGEAIMEILRASL